MKGEISFIDANGANLARFMYLGDGQYWGGLAVEGLPNNSIYREAFMQSHYYETLTGMLRAIRVLVKNTKYCKVTNTGTDNYLRVVLAPEMRVADLAKVLEASEDDIRDHFSSTIYIV